MSSKRMNPIAMLLLIIVAHAVFFWSAIRRWQLLRIGRFTNRFDRIPERIAAVIRYAFAQEKMNYYQPAGWAHKLIFIGFIVLLLRTLVLWGRGIDPSWNFFILGPHQAVGKVYEFAKDCVALLVLTGVSVFVYYRVVKPQKRMTLRWEGLLIRGCIGTMMMDDILYGAPTLTLLEKHHDICGTRAAPPSVNLCARIGTLTAPFGSPSEVHGPGFPPSPSP